MPNWFRPATRVALICALLAVTYLSLAPSVPNAPAGNDKLAHALAYCCLALLLLLALEYPPSLTARALLVFAAIVTYGALIEIVQRFTGREFELLDMVANAGGAVVGIAGAGMIEHWLTPTRER
jgi:VanZ family protein